MLKMIRLKKILCSASVLIRAAKRWRRVSFTKTELNCLDRLREELGIKEKFQDIQELKEAC
ncbi:MAG: hypothetical protein LWW94_10005 [Candidatus Desulfofervidaceae bacterium]|nr:hypothetical protein [Candidatus Desulfofervidaceae bacterium]